MGRGHIARRCISEIPSTNGQLPAGTFSRLERAIILIPYDANEFAGKRILVTGGTKGAGKAIADRFQRGGATVIITARSAPTEKTDSGRCLDR